MICLMFGFLFWPCKAIFHLSQHCIYPTNNACHDISYLADPAWPTKIWKWNILDIYRSELMDPSLYLCLRVLPPYLP